MKIEEIRKESFAVIGKEGSTEEGAGFVQRLWEDTNAHFGEISHLAKKDEQGNPVGFWGAMTDVSRSFLPWEEDFSKGLYLAGVECEPDADAPAGWAKWEIPGFVYLRAECDGGDVVSQMLAELQNRGISLAGAVHDHTCPRTGKNYMYFPMERL